MVAGSKPVPVTYFSVWSDWQLKCCGAKGPDDWSKSEYEGLPDSCCREETEGCAESVIFPVTIFTIHQEVSAQKFASSKAKSTIFRHTNNAALSPSASDYIIILLMNMRIAILKVPKGP